MDGHSQHSSREAIWARLASYLLIREPAAVATAPLLFAEEELPWRPPYEPAEVRGRLEVMLARMRAAGSWPWKSATVAFYRETLWPSLLGKLPHDEATRLRTEMEAEITRLDLAS